MPADALQAKEATPEADVRDVIDAFFRALDTQNFDLMQQITGRDADMVHIGTDVGEIWNGWDELRATTREQFEGLEYYEAQVRDLSVHVSPAGDVAWYAHLLDARIKSKGSAEHRWQGARFTGVLERREGRWVMVQTHVSLPESASS